jgi:hypothetical protein
MFLVHLHVMRIIKYLALTLSQPYSLPFWKFISQQLNSSYDEVYHN